MTDLSAIEALFSAALEKPAAERAAFLDHACRDNPDLRAHVDRLLAAHPRVGAFLEPSPAEPDPVTEDHTPLLDVGNILDGKYKLLEEIGEGGMGAVWMAQQTEPIKRLVAVKVIKAGMDSKAVLARFDAERQALALMDHPNISRVLDAGSTTDGRPFFVMELVKGVPITQFCDQRHLTPRQRLELFVPVCQAIQHAHQKGVIHRDIKPRNVLVALYDDHPVPKVIDFGVAKAMGQPLTEQTLNTGFGTVVGTPEYMSPEQATFNNLDIDTRSDVYALGVLLYELLTGSPPITRGQLEKAGLLEVLRVVREEEPPRPSTRLSTADTLPSLAANRGMEPRKLTGLLRNELDWIVMKALEKDRRRRYESANGFAADVLRYLSGEPVQAVPPSVGYRLRKFVRKNRGPVLGALAVLVVLVLGMVGTTWGMVRAERAKTAETEQQRVAEAKEADRAREETARVKAEAEVERQQAEVKRQQEAENQRRVRNREAVATLLKQVEIALKDGNARLASEAEEQIKKRIDEGGADDLREKFGRYQVDLAMLRELDQIDNHRWTVVNGKLPLWSEIDPLWVKAFAGYGIRPGITSPQEAALRIKESLIWEQLLISLEVWLVADDYDRVLRNILTTADPDEFRNKTRVTSYQLAVLSQAFLGKPLQPQPVWFAIGQATNRKMDRALREHLLLSALQAKPNSFQILMELAALDEANDKESGPRRSGWYRAALAVQPANVAAWNNLGVALRNSGDVFGAIASFKEAIHFDPKSAPAHHGLGTALQDSGDLPGAIASFKEAIHLDPKNAPTHNNLGNALKDSSDVPGAIIEYKEAIRLDPKNALPHYNLGISLIATGDVPGAITSFKEAIRLDPKYAPAHNNLGVALNKYGDIPGAIAAFKEAIRLDPKHAPAHYNLGNELNASGNSPGAIAAFKEAIRLDPKHALAHYNLGNILTDLGKLPEAIAAYKESIRIDPKYALAHNNLGNALFHSGAKPEAIAAYKESIRLDPKYGPTYSNLGNALADSGNVPDAIVAYKESIRLDPKNALAYYNLGTVLKASGNIPDAIVAYKESIRLDPKKCFGPRQPGCSLPATEEVCGCDRLRPRSYPNRSEVLVRACHARICPSTNG